MRLFFIVIAIFFYLSLQAQQEIPLYKSGSIPNSKVITDEGNAPSLSIFLPQDMNPNRTAVIICPGGGYMKLSMGGEGIDVAKWFNSIGVAAFVLRYRLPNDKIMINKTIGPLQDAQRAIQLVRERASEWRINTNHIGILGFSAGGHLASTTGTHFLEATIPNTEHISLRPDFMVLIYPVISLADSICHMGSRISLLGYHPDSATVIAYSNERQVTSETPPTFIVQAEDDEGVPVFNSLYFYEALVKKNVPAELIIYPKGGHAFGLSDTKTGGDEWTDRLKNWFRSNGWL